MKLGFNVARSIEFHNFAVQLKVVVLYLLAVFILKTSLTPDELNCDFLKLVF